MKKEKSCGAIIINGNQVLLIKSKIGHISFPKGHVEANETDVMTAIREVKEEVNLDIEIDSSIKTIITYHPYNNDVVKDVILFKAKPITFDIKPQVEEVEWARWTSIDDAYKLITYDNDKQALDKLLKDGVK